MNNKLTDFKPYLDNINEVQLDSIYEFVIGKMDRLLTPLQKIDVCFFLSTQKDWFVQDVARRKTIYISIKYDLEEIDLILAHE